MTAWRCFGTGRHPAALNVDDCFLYALAEGTGLPIVCAVGAFALVSASPCLGTG